MKTQTDPLNTNSFLLQSQIVQKLIENRQRTSTNKLQFQEQKNISLGIAQQRPVSQPTVKYNDKLTYLSQSLTTNGSPPLNSLHPKQLSKIYTSELSRYQIEAEGVPSKIQQFHPTRIDMSKLNLEQTLGERQPSTSTTLDKRNRINKKPALAKIFSQQTLGQASIQLEDKIQKEQPNKQLRPVVNSNKNIDGTNKLKILPANFQSNYKNSVKESSNNVTKLQRPKFFDTHISSPIHQKSVTWNKRSKPQKSDVNETDITTLVNLERKSPRKIKSQDSSIFQKPFKAFEYYMSCLHYFNQDVIPHLKFEHQEIAQLYSIDSKLTSFTGYRDHFLQNYSFLQYCKQFKKCKMEDLKSRMVSLSPLNDNQCILQKINISIKDRGTIVFDMDETLIHCSDHPTPADDVVLPIKFPNGELLNVKYNQLNSYAKAYISLRPFVREMLEALSQVYELIVFTASSESYATKVLDFIEQDKKWFQKRLFRESCYITSDGLLVKDLRILENRNLKKVVLVDNAAYSYCFQLNNGIPVLPYYDNKLDRELLHLTNYLLTLNEDYTKQNKQMFGMQLYQEGMQPNETLIMLFQDKCIKSQTQ